MPIQCMVSVFAVQNYLNLNLTFLKSSSESAVTACYKMKNILLQNCQYLKIIEKMAEEENEITIEDLELSLEVYEIESDQKLAQLKQLFQEKGSLDLAKMFYEERSSIEIKFQNIISDLIEFLVKQEVATTEKLRKTFYRILENPLLLLFKVSRFQIFDLRLNGFDIELEPIEAIQQLAKTLYVNIDEYLAICAKDFEPYDGKQYKSWDSFMEQATINKIQDKIFIFYSYLRKGSAILKKKFENKVLIVEIFNNIANKLLPTLLKKEDSKTLKQISVLNYEIYELENSFDVLHFYLRIPFQQKYKEIFQQFELLAYKCKQASNYNIFILQYVKFGKQILFKLKNEKFDPCYKSYLQNAYTAILQMWGCRICYYRQFCELFTELFKLHPDEIEALEICLKHTPDLKKDDIVLLRTNFKLEIEKKHNQLLLLLKSMNLEELNDFLNNFYHKTFYNLDFKQINREKIISILTLMNGNSSLSQFFAIVEKAMKEWNHTIDFSHSHKYIETQYAYPNISEEKVKQSEQLLTNLCTLEDKGFDKDYETLIKANSIGKSLLGLIKFMTTNEKCQSLLGLPETERLFAQSFYFLRKCLNPATDGENLVDIYSGLLKNMKDSNLKAYLSKGITEYARQNIENFHIANCLTNFSKLENKDYHQIIEIFMSGTKENNSTIENFKYLDKSISDLSQQKVSESQAKFITQYFVNKNGVVSFKDTGIFRLSELEIMTNPTQFDKVMDTYYFNLDSNSKKFIEYLSTEWNNSRESNKQMYAYYSSLIEILIESYPISIPLLASVRLNFQEASKRFVQVLCLLIGDDLRISKILTTITNCSCIRYRNGKDYVQQQIAPMAVKQIITKINSNTSDKKAQNFYILACILKRINLMDFKLDTIQKSIEKVRFCMKNTTDPKEAVKMSEAYNILMESFFNKKQMEIRKQNLMSGYQKLIWNEVRNYASSSNESSKEILDEKIVEQIVVTPFTISQDFNIAEYKIKKNTPSKQNQEYKDKNIAEFLEKLPKINDDKPRFSAGSSSFETVKTIDLSNIKYDINVYLGKENIQNRAARENIELLFSKDEKQDKPRIVKKRDETTSFIQYYMKELEVPAINHKTILKNVTELLEEQEPTISHLWTNSKNLEYYFIDLFSVFQFASLEKDKRKAEKNEEISKIVENVEADNLKIMKKILKLFSCLGYTNIWAESLNIFWNNFPIRKFLNVDQPSEESILSIVLRITLENEDLQPYLAEFLGKLFETRNDQTVLMYKVTLDKPLMNCIMKSLSISNMHEISLLFHSNFNNLRLYTDQLHEGMKALNMASKNRSYNEYIKISKSVEDEQFSGPMKLFKENFKFFIRIQKQGYGFKKNEEIKLALDRLTNIFRSSGEKQNVTAKVDEVMEGYIRQITELQLAIANRVKSFYLVTKLRDLSYQNAVMIPIINEVMRNAGQSNEQIIEEIEKVELFSLMNQLSNELIRFEDDWRNVEKYQTNKKVDGYTLENQLTICSTRRFSHSMSKVYEKCDLELDEVIQRCIDELKTFFVTEIGSKWMQSLEIYPAFLIKSFIDHEKASLLSDKILSTMKKNKVDNYTFEVAENSLVEGLLKGFRQAQRANFCSQSISISYKGKKYTPIQILKPLQERLLNNETMVVLKSSENIVFNKYKSSEATLEQIEILGYIISYSLLNNLPLNLNLHPSIVCALSFNIAQLDYLLDVDFKIWEQLRNVLSVSDCSTMALNFSYNFESLENFKPVRVELIDKGSSKKVNNLNREEYCDLVCCYMLYENIRPQINRLLTTILSIVPKDFISCLSTKRILELFFDKQKTQKILDEYMKKIGVVFPETIINDKGKRIENLKDYQNVQWLQDLILSSPKLRDKYWKDETNIFIVTGIGSQGSVKLINKTFLIEHFASKEEMKAALDKL